MQHNTTTASWNQDNTARLRELWDEGHPAAEIGRRLGITKNAVIGKAWRLDLPPRPTAQPTVASPMCAPYPQHWNAISCRRRTQWTVAPPSRNLTFRRLYVVPAAGPSTEAKHCEKSQDSNRSIQWPM